MRKNLLIIFPFLLLAITAQSIENKNIKHDEANIISGLHDVEMMLRLERLCYGYISNMQRVYSTGTYQELKRRLGEDRFYRYYNSAKKETTTLLDFDRVKLLKREDRLEETKRFCEEELAYWRIGTANILLNSAENIKSIEANDY